MTETLGGCRKRGSTEWIIIISNNNLKKAISKSLVEP